MHALCTLWLLHAYRACPVEWMCVLERITEIDADKASYDETTTGSTLRIFLKWFDNNPVVAVLLALVTSGEAPTMSSEIYLLCTT